MSATLTTMTTLLREKFKVQAELGAQSRLNELGLDSLDVINFLFSLEEKLGVKIPDEALDAENLRTLADIAGYVDRHR
jgi:acyl carrier protein